MRTYQHIVDEAYLRNELAGPWSEALEQTRRQLAEGSTAEFNLTAALDVYFDGICYAWGLNDNNALSQLREHLSRLADHTFEEFPDGDIHEHSSYSTLARVGAAADKSTVIRYAEVLNGRRRQPIRDRDPHAYSQDLLDALVHLILGHDGAAHAASVRFYQHLHHPRTPPTVHLMGIPHAIQAVVAGDKEALQDAASLTIAHFVEQAGPLRDRPAGAASLVYPTLSLISRVATWRGIPWPDSPYVLRVAETGAVTSNLVAGG